MKRDVRRFSVRQKTPRMRFPVDMLRYDACYPAGEGESAKTVRALEYEDVGEVELVGHSDQPHARYPTRARWESFGWEVQS